MRAVDSIVKYIEGQGMTQEEAASGCLSDRKIHLFSFFHQLESICKNNLYQRNKGGVVMKINYQIMSESQKNRHGKYIPDFEKLIAGATTLTTVPRVPISAIFTMYPCFTFILRLLYLSVYRR